MTIKKFDRQQYVTNFKKLERLNTICIAANCPNRYECFANKTATFLILGDVCTRSCKYCNVKTGIPSAPNNNEIDEIITVISTFNLQYVVITQVTRDDLEDGGASFFVAVINQIRERFPKIKIEVLISDLGGDWSALEKIINARPDVLNHNIEVVSAYFKKLRPEGNYERSLTLLQKANDAKIITKSGLMVGFGESEKEIKKTMQDLLGVGVQILTIGQYLSPNSNSARLEKKYSVEEFEKLEKLGLRLGFRKVVAGSLVRSSYLAREVVDEL